MISIYVGADTRKAKEIARLHFERLRSEHPDGVVGYFDDILFDIGVATELIGSESLFGGRKILYFDGILDHPQGEEFYRTVLHDGDFDIIVREPELDKDLLAFLGRIGKVSEFGEERPQKRRADSFAVATALGRRDKRGAWVELEKARRAGLASEEIHGTIFWAFKTMLISLEFDRPTALRLGVKESSYRTYGSFAKNYAADEIKDKISTLKEIYHKGHRGELVLDDAIEKFVLGN